MERYEHLILMNLRKNARETLTNLSRKTDVPVSTVFNRLKNCEKNIFSYTSLVDFSKLGYNLKVTFALKTRKRQELLEFLLKNKSINNIYRCKDRYDFFIEAIFKNVSELYKFCEELEQLISKKVEYHVVQELKKEDFLTKPEHFCL